MSPKRKIFCVSDVYARYAPDVRERGDGGGGLQNKRSWTRLMGTKSQFWVERFLMDDPLA